ncbi:M48 family metallopeptidase [Janthinobacterium psychrotolerans]|uniref:M48 family metallopeptidase n=1 Tax=Janthinobacterium psychrotolerans TaxID=1747903 RepID=UPI001FDF03D1|nr:M48 family metallopeptidase [Janthinobacterium psychrotolerans]
MALPLLVACAALLAGCTTPGGTVSGPFNMTPAPDEAPAYTAQQKAAQDNLVKMVALQDRLSKVSAPLLINNADLCKSYARNLLGFTAQNKYSYPGVYADAAQAALGYGEQMQVSSVLPGSGAARAGLRKGDGLVAAEGKPLPAGPNAEGPFGAIVGPLASKSASISMTITREGQPQDLKIPVTRACAFRVALGNADNINAYSDGARIMLTRGMVHAAQNDEGIAFVIAREMAHNILDHARSQRNTGTAGGIIDSLGAVQPDVSMLTGAAGIRAMPQELDAQADTLAIYLLARAGYNVDNASRFWQRLATQVPASTANGYTALHPGMNSRIAAINRAVIDVRARQAAKKPLRP